MGGEHRMQMMFTTSSPAAHLESVTTIRRIRQLILVTANASDRIGCCDKAANRATDVSMLLLKTHIKVVYRAGLRLGVSTDRLSATYIHGVSSAASGATQTIITNYVWFRLNREFTSIYCLDLCLFQHVSQ